jgi:LuxR family maltose regulon positive regulatory protein
MLSDWARHGCRPVAWLSLDRGDNDPARFWRHAAAALYRVLPGIAEQVGPLLGPASATGGCLIRLLQAFEGTRVLPRSGRGPPTAGLAEALTGRELAVLELLAAGRSNQAIAADLVLTLDTIKKHVSNVLAKLGAANRTEAVTWSRELGLIS